MVGYWGNEPLCPLRAYSVTQNSAINAPKCFILAQKWDFFGNGAQLSQTLPLVDPTHQVPPLHPDLDYATAIYLSIHPSTVLCAIGFVEAAAATARVSIFLRPSIHRCKQ